MKRQKTKAKPTAKAAKKTPSAPTTTTPAPRSRRDVLRSARNYGIAAAVLGGGGWYLATDVYASFGEHDLTRIGDGVPAVVQIHDPGCPICRRLQREARAAMTAFDDGALRYVVADITTPEGRRLAGVHDVGHATLLLFDGAGQRRSVLRGEADRALLEDAFRRHVAAEAGS